MAGDFPESRVLQIWEECPGRNDLETEEEGPVKVLYPGRINDDSGADFRDAVIATSRGLLTGDIEVHTRSSQWWAHRHHLDPVYNRVVLHVVFWRDMAKSVRLENGREIPTLALEGLFRKSGGRVLPVMLPIPCRGIGEMSNCDFLPGILDAAGEQRFQSRAAGFQAASSPDEAGQALYRGIMAALGYAKNQHAMAELACRMPLRRLESAVRPGATAVECLAMYQARLMGTAGLLPSPRVREREGGEQDRWIGKLERLWAAAGEAITMSANDWHFFRVRPGNLPTRRIAAMSRLLLRYRSHGLLNGLTNKLANVPLDGNCRKVEDALIIGGSNYDDEDMESSLAGKESGMALLGRQRAADIVINVLLPFALAWGRANSRPELAGRALNLYRVYPALSSNTLERHMSRQFGIAGLTVRTARRQQGLLHIFKTYCSVGGCQNCPVNQAVSRTIGAR